MKKAAKPNKARDQKAKKKIAPGKNLYFKKIILPLGVSSILPNIKGKNVSPRSITFEIRNPESPTRPLNKTFFRDRVR